MQEKLNNQPWLLIADGEPLSWPHLKKLAKNKRVMVLDGAYSYVRNAGLKVDILLGDFDSVSEADIAEARDSGTVIKPTPDQNKTDFQKGLLYLDELAATSIDICAAVGRRLQHTLYNLRMLKKFYKMDRPLRLFSAKEIIYYEQDKEILIEGNINDGMAVLGFPQAVVSSKGLQYEMENLTLDFEGFNAVSNKFIQDKVTLKIVGGALIIHEMSC